MKDNNLEVQMIAPQRLVANSWNPNHITSIEVEQKLDESIRRFGLFKPVLVRELGDGTLEIIGGEHRVRRCEELGVEEVPVINLGKIDDVKAKEIGLLDNGRYGSDDALELAELLKQIEPDFQNFLPYSDADLAAIESAESINFDDFEMDESEEANQAVPSATISSVQTHQIMRFKVPVDDAHAIEDVIAYIIKAQKLVEGDSLTNSGDALVWLVKNAKTDG